jgi:hypothetical protein
MGGVSALNYRSINKRDLGSGLFFCGVAVLYGSISLMSLPIGQVFNMGPGFFPILLCAILLLIGGALLVRSLLDAESVAFGSVPWRAIAMVSLGIGAFAMLLNPAGLPLAVFAATLIATFAAPNTKLLASIVTAAAIAAFCVGVFIFGARMQAPLLGYWFGG